MRQSRVRLIEPILRLALAMGAHLRWGTDGHRYSKSLGFSQPSVFCEGLQDFYAHVAAFLLRRRLPFDHLRGVLEQRDRAAPSRRAESLPVVTA